jgi:integrase
MAKGRRGHGEGSIYQRESDGLWVAVVNLGWQGGKRKRKYLYGKTRKEVAEQLNDLLSKHQRGLPVALPRQTLEQFLTSWLESEVKPNREPNTYRSYELIVRLHILPDLGKIQLAKLTPQHVRAMLARKEAAGVTAQRRKSIKMVLSVALNRALKWELVSRNVAALVDAPKVDAKEKPPWTREEALRFLEVAKCDRIGAIFSVALALGLRRGEAMGLKWEDVDLDGGRLHVRYQLQQVKGEGMVRKALKTARSRRTIALPAPIVAGLKAHQTKQEHDRWLAGSRWKETGYVFTSTIGTPLQPTNLNVTFGQLVAEAGIPYRNFHSQRHWCATLLLAQGVPPRVVMDILGHSTIGMTMDRYGHVLDESRRDAADVMGRILEGESKEGNR